MATYAPRTAANKCVFCDIVEQGDRSVYFWENAEFVAFLSIDPNTVGFSCVIPKAHYGSDVLKMPDEVLQRFILAAKSAGAVLEDYFDDVGRVGVIMEGTGIDHAHIKLVPMHGTDDLKRGEWRQYASGVEHYFDRYAGWLSSAGGPRVERAELLALTEKIKQKSERRTK